MRVLTVGGGALGTVLAMLTCGFGATVSAQDLPALEQTVGQQQSRPNIVVFLADDLGFTDIAPFGSEINTPTLTALAARGVSFTNYHTAANCAPARAMLLTGVNNHRAGVANIPETVPLEHRQYPQYQGVLGSNVVTVATRTRATTRI